MSPKIDLGLEARQTVLIYSLTIESMTSIFLALLLGIDAKQISNTKSFSNKGTALSFAQTINLLIDLNTFTSEDYKKFDCFMSIRNQFMHNLEASSYEKCFSFLDGKDKYLFKIYPQDKSLSKEKQLEKAVADLSNNVVKLVITLTENIKESIIEKIKAKNSVPMKDALAFGVAAVELYLNRKFDKKKFSSFKEEDFEDLGKKVRKVFWRTMNLSYKEITKEDTLQNEKDISF